MRNDTSIASFSDASASTVPTYSNYGIVSNTPNTNTAGNGSSGSGLSQGASIGIGVGIAVAIIALLGTVLCCAWRKLKTDVTKLDGKGQNSDGFWDGNIESHPENEEVKNNNT